MDECTVPTITSPSIGANTTRRKFAGIDETSVNGNRGVVRIGVDLRTLVPNQPISPFYLAFSASQHIIKSQCQSDAWDQFVCISKKQTRFWSVSSASATGTKTRVLLLVDRVLYCDCWIIRECVRGYRDRILDKFREDTMT